MKRLRVLHSVVRWLGNAGVRRTARKQIRGYPPANANFVGDDDGGLTEMCLPIQQPRGLGASGAVPAMKSVQQVSIFLGAAWAISKQGPANQTPRLRGNRSELPYRASSTIT